MNEILITSKEITDTNKRLEASAGKVTASIWVSSLGVWVCNTSNASHRAWRGLGRRFNTLFEAREAYRSKAMRGIIQEAIREFSVAGGEA